MAEGCRRVIDRLLLVEVALWGLGNPTWLYLEIRDQRIRRTEIVPFARGIFPDVVAAVRFAK